MDAEGATQTEGFSFNFLQNADDQVEEDDFYDNPGAPAEEEYYRPTEIDQDSLEAVSINDEVSLLKGRVSADSIVELLEEPKAAESDLIPGVYEGGFKLWEGSVDLCKFLLNKYQLKGSTFKGTDVENELQGKRVLELGCGHGLPGMLALMAGADVHFQDYNKVVLTSLTIPNVTANLNSLAAGRPRPSCRFFSGDWLNIGEYLTSQGFGGYYDIILTSESVYSLESQRRLLECIKQVLQPPHGVVYVASKTFYFGVGGGTKSFREVVKRDGIFEVKTVSKVEEAGSGNVREVLELRFPASIVPYFL
mmetsp:Transcript_29020/g.64017  ORF Transcript_29020/g.64017 Transcript_29020/m.64017 type:complete len:307 (-) Transcript_29020:2360-3280(-)